MSTALATHEEKQHSALAHNDVKLLLLEQILKELKDVSSHLKKQETRLKYVEENLQENSKSVGCLVSNRDVSSIPSCRCSVTQK